MDSIPVQLLNAFVVFNDSANISHAAERLGVTQPALSKQLQRLQEMMPEPVFTQSGRKKVLTSFGRSLNTKLKSRFGDLQQLVHQVQIAHSDPRATLVRIGARREILDRLSAKLKFVGSIEFVECSNQEAIDKLLQMKLDLGIIHSVPDSSELIAKPLFREEFRIVVPKRMIARKPTLSTDSIREIMKAPCVAYRLEDEIVQAVCDYYGFKYLDLKINRATENYASLAAMVDNSMGWSVLPSYLEVSESKNWILPLPIQAIPKRAFMVSYRSELASAPWLKEFLRECQALNL